MSTLKSTIMFLACLSVAFACGSSTKPGEVVELECFPADTMDGVINKTGVQVDKAITSDGNGSLKMAVDKPTTIKLYETGDIDIENARMIYQAKVRTEDAEGQVYIEMWCNFPGHGEFFSRALQSPLSGSNDWSSMGTPFLLKEGQNPDNVKINIVINGKGTVWIDDICLLKAPL
jgi:hypothetical protein